MIAEFFVLFDQLSAGTIVEDGIYKLRSPHPNTSRQEETAMIENCKRRFAFNLFLAALAIVISGIGCKKGEDTPQTKPPITIDNLQVAYGAAMKRVDWYQKYARKAEREGLRNVAQLLRAIVRSEEIHAANHAKFLKDRGFEPRAPQIDSIPIGSTRQHLKSALSTESIEFESMYPNLIRTAEFEQIAEVVDQFKQCRDVDMRHAELLKDAIDRNANIPRVTYFMCPACGYLMTSEKTEECPVCHMTRSKFEKIS